MSVEEILERGEARHNARISQSKLRTFLEMHNPHVEKESPDPVFKHAYSFTYTPATCGTCVSISCVCGAKKDITDDSDW